MTAIRDGMSSVRDATAAVRDGMIAVEGGRYRLGSDAHYPEERPLREVEVRRFAIDRAPVTNREFSEFVRSTAYVTLAERAAPAGSAVFRMTERPVDLRDPSNWWTFAPGASWKYPDGPGSGLDGRDDHPVVHVAYEDACAFAKWCGKRLPDECEWEAAARDGLDAATYAWGEELTPQGRLMANFWTGAFPWYFARGTPGTTAVGSFPAARSGAVDMIGNVWEWTRTPMHDPKPCGCTPPPLADAAAADAMLVLKGGSWLCAAEYCARYRPAARIALSAESTTAHVGFRCAADL